MAFSYEKAHIKFIERAYMEGLTWAQISRTFNEAFGAGQSPDAIRHAIARRAETKDKLRQFDQTRTGLGLIKKTISRRRGRIGLTSVMPSPVDHPYAAQIFRPFIKAFETWENTNKDSIFKLIPMKGHQTPLQKTECPYDQFILDHHRHRFTTEMTINNNLMVFDAKLNPQQLNPLTGLHHIQDGKPGYLFRGEDHSGIIGHYIKNKRPSLIIAHPKQLMECQPNGPSSLPRIIHSTGVCNLPGYRRQERVGRISNTMHTVGGLIIDLVDDYFFIRQIQADLEDGSFVDLGFRYHADGRVTEESPLLAKIGDWHVWETDLYARQATFEQLEYLLSEEIFWEDFLTGLSVNPHDDGKPGVRSRMPEEYLSLRNEGRACADELNEIVRRFPNQKHIMNHCNHHMFVNRWLDKAAYKNDPINFKIGHELQIAYQRGINPVQILIDSNKDDIIDAIANGFESKMEWLSGQQSYFVEGVDQSNHGHIGVKGSKGSKNTIYKAYGKANIAHVHDPYIYNGIYAAGSNATLKQEYNKYEPITTMHANVYQYKGGHRQIVTTIGGVWAL